MNNTTAATASTFEDDLARVLEIKRAHAGSAPAPAAAICAAFIYNRIHKHRGALLAFIDKLWKEYSRTLQQLDQMTSLVGNVLPQLHDAVSKPTPEPFPGHGNATTAANRPSAITAGEAAASDGDSACPAVTASTHEPKPGDGWRENATYLLDHCPHTIRVRDTEHPDALLTSLVVTFQKMQTLLERAPQSPPTVHNARYDATGWICSICHGWNAAQSQQCVHAHSGSISTTRESQS